MTTAPEHRCPDHPDAALVPIVERHPAIQCPTCRVRVCSGCNGPDASWFSGMSS